MSLHIQFLIVGLGAGAVYAALAMGLVVLHKGAAMISFAQGALALYGAYVYAEIRSTGTLVAPIGSVHVGTAQGTAIGLGVASVAVLGVTAHLLVFRPLRLAPPLAKVVASVGLMIATQSLIILRFSGDARAVAPILPNEVVEVGGAIVPRDRLYLGAIVVFLAVVLWAVFRFTRFGLATRAAAEDETAAALAGYSPDRLAAGAWVIAGAVPALVAILAAPMGTLNPTTYTLYVVPALAVALLARLESIGVACVGGLVMGVIQSELSLLVSRSWWPEWAEVGIADALPFLVIVVILLAFGRTIPDRATGGGAILPPVPRPGPLSIPGALAGPAAAVVLLLVTAGSYRFGLITSMIFAVIALSLVIVTGLVGQISLAQAAFAGAAGFTLSQIDLPFPVSVVVAGTVAAALGALVGLPALRIRGAQLAVVTLASAVAIERFVFRNPFFSSPGGNPIPKPTLFGLDLSVHGAGGAIRVPFGLLVLVVLSVAALAVRNLIRSDTGRTFIAVRRNERAAAAAGVNVAAVKLTAFVLSSFLAGVGGCLLGYSRGQLSADSFGVMAGVSMLAFAYMGGITTVRGAVVAGLFAPLGIGFVLLDRHTGLDHYYALASGIGLMLAAITSPNGIARLTPAVGSSALRGRLEGGRRALRVRSAA